MQINQNIPAMFAHRSLTNNQNGVSTSMERLSSGLRINRAADDAAGLAIAETMRAQVNGLNQGQRNAGDGVSLLRTAEGALNETHAILQRMRTLAVQAANSGVMSPDNLRTIQVEMDQLTSEIDRIAYHTEFNGMTLLDGTFRDKKLQVGANSGDTKTVTIMSALVPAVPPRPAIPPVSAGVALWDLDKENRLAAIADPVTFTHTLAGEEASVDVSLDPLPSSLPELIDRLNGDPGFSASFTAKAGTHVRADGTSEIINLIVVANEGGRGGVSVSGIPSDESKLEKDPGRDEIPETPGVPEYGRGYGSADILGPIDVTREPGSSTEWIEIGGGTGGGTTRWFGNIRENPVVPTETVRVPRTTTWGAGATDAIAQIDRAIAIVSKGRAEMGATENALEHTMRSVSVSAENLALSESHIRDADMAKEIVDLQRWQILAQASMQMLSQANMVPQSVLKLLQ